MIDLKKYKSDLQEELKNILSFWMEYAIDNQNGGFYGRLDNNNTVYPEAPKGCVLNSRILWAFSAACQLTKNGVYLETAERAFNYIRDHFIDKKFGGVYWTTDHLGRSLDEKKQIYALAFAVYGLSEYYGCSNNEEAKSMAIELYEKIVTHSYDKVYGGYIEALARDWNKTDDLRLSSKDANEKKSMNTHLHLLEGFASLYRVWPNERLKQRIIELVNIFLKYIINKETNHLVLFFDEQWNKRSNIISYGHDIEAAWLIQEAAELAGEEALAEKVKQQSLKLAKAVIEGFDKDGGLWYEFDVDANNLISEKHSWPQAESMIGFFNAWQISGNEDHLLRSVNSWRFINKHILDTSKGEWVWGINKDYSVMDEDKVGIWKCPYHNSRACIEIIKRIMDC